MEKQQFGTNFIVADEQCKKSVDSNSWNNYAAW